MNNGETRSRCHDCGTFAFCDYLGYCADCESDRRDLCLQCFQSRPVTEGDMCFECTVDHYKYHLVDTWNRLNGHVSWLLESSSGSATLPGPGPIPNVR